MEFILSLLLSLTSSASAMQVGAATISGNGCAPHTEAKPQNSKGVDGYVFPLKLSIAKNDLSQLERKVCQLALPIKLGKKEKLQVLNVSQNVNLKAFGGAHTKLALTVSAAGQVGAAKPLEIEVKNPTALDEDLKHEGLVFETPCGKDAIVRAQVSAFVQGSGTASASTGDLSLSLKAVSCK